MFQSKLIMRFHHFYLIQAIVEIQRHCNKLYTKLKHKLILLISFRFHQLSRLKVLTNFRKNKTNFLSYNNNDNCYYESDENCYENINNNYLMGKHCCNEIVGNGKFFNDLNQFFQMNQTLCEGAKSAVSIPMQMLLLPFITVQASSITQSTTDQEAIKINNNNNNKNMFLSSQQIKQNHHQWHDIDINNQLEGNKYLINGCQIVTTQPTKSSDYNNFNQYHAHSMNQQKSKINLLHQQDSLTPTSWKKSQQNWSTTSCPNNYSNRWKTS